MRRSLIDRFINGSYINFIRGHLPLKSSENANIVQTSAENVNKTLINKGIIQRKLTDLNNFYTKLLGLDEVKAYQDRVSVLQEKLLQTQDERRETGRKLHDIRLKSNELQDEILKLKRQDNLDRYFELMTKETENFKLEQAISRKFQEIERTERELFTAFTNAIRDSHEKQRAQMEYSKYFGVILSIFGSFLTYFFATLRKEDLKRFIDKRLTGVPVYGDASKEIISLIQRQQSVLDAVLANQNKIAKDSNKSDLELVWTPTNAYYDPRNEAAAFLQGSFLLFGGLIILYIIGRSIS